MPMRKQNEAAIARALWQHYTLRRAPGVWGCAIPNGIRSNPIAIRNEKLKGFLPGAPDYHFLKNGEPFYLEIKAEGGRLSKNQGDEKLNIEIAGGYHVVAEGLEEALRILEVWGIITTGGVNARSNDVSTASPVALDARAYRRIKGARG